MHCFDQIDSFLLESVVLVSFLHDEAFLKQTINIAPLEDKMKTGQ